MLNKKEYGKNWVNVGKHWEQTWSACLFCAMFLPFSMAVCMSITWLRPGLLKKAIWNYWSLYWKAPALLLEPMNNDCTEYVHTVFPQPNCRIWQFKVQPFCNTSLMVWIQLKVIAGITLTEVLLQIAGFHELLLHIHKTLNGWKFLYYIVLQFG